ncbi:MAG: hypothetical protein LBF62_05920 [Tannerellaceae bacterium]|jgi:hypothetical protein|nr:hypothetical protein [Tannerellaceae bacterium]
MARSKLTNSQIVCIALLWGFLCYLLLAGSPKIDFHVVFALAASGIIVFVTIYKNVKSRNK